MASPSSTGKIPALPQSSASAIKETVVPVPVTEGAIPKPPLFLILLAFAAVYLIWGSTYLGIRLATETMPPFLVAGSRFLLAGTLLYSVLRWRGEPNPPATSLKDAAIIGGLLLVGGNGGVSWAQQYVPTGVSALIVASVPLWIVVTDWLRPRGTRPRSAVMIGLALGFVGVILMVLGKDAKGHAVVVPMGAAVLVLSTITWALGSIYSRHAKLPGSALMSIALQMMTGGALQLLTGVLLGELPRFHPELVSATSAWAFVYLTLIGSLVGFTAYVWLMRVCSPALVSTYAYVNPLVAVALGSLVLKEPVPHAMVLAGGLILVSVILITVTSARKKTG
ncbi:MAG: EamA family transporter [Verrucomicrobium sp.]